MKTLKYTLFFALATLLMAAECTKEDDEFYNAVYTTIPGLVSVETQSNYQVNDVLWLNTNTFSRYLAEPNQSTPLDVYKTTNATKFSFLFTIEKKTGEDLWVSVANGNNFIVESGSVSINNYITAFAIYNQVTEKYEFRGGIKLTEPGEFRIGFFAGYNGENFDIISDSSTSSTFLTIATTANSLASGYYTFTVN